MALVRLNNYLRTKRKHSGLSQSEVSFLVRLKNKAELSRYERNVRAPSLRTALACQELYGIAVSDLFAGLSDSVASDTRRPDEKIAGSAAGKGRPEKHWKQDHAKAPMDLSPAVRKAEFSARLV